MDDKLREKDRTELERDPRIVFYYNRDDRLKRMPQSKKLYEGGFLPKGGFLRSLTGTKSNRFLLTGLMVLLISVVFLGFFGKKNDQTVINGAQVKMSAFAFGDTIYVLLRFSAAAGASEEIPVKILVGTYDSAKNLIDSKELSGVYSGEQTEFKTTFTDLEVFQVAAVIQTGSAERTVSVRIERK